MNDILCGQLALDYCCTPDMVRDSANHFTVWEPLDGQRQFPKVDDCYLKLAVVGGKLLFTGHREIIAWCEAQFRDCVSDWFLEMQNLRLLDKRMQEDGWQIRTMHPFFLRERAVCLEPQGCELRWYDQADIEQFRGDERFDRAYSFCETAPDIIGVGAYSDGQILGMAGASRDSTTMWQIGIDVLLEARGQGLAQMLVSQLATEIERRNALPFYGTAFSHFASQRVALGTGFIPTWAELATERIS